MREYAVLGGGGTSVSEQLHLKSRLYIALGKECCSIRLSGHIDLCITGWLCPLGEHFCPKDVSLNLYLTWWCVFQGDKGYPITVWWEIKAFGERTGRRGRRAGRGRDNMSSCLVKTPSSCSHLPADFALHHWIWRGFPLTRTGVCLIIEALLLKDTGRKPVDSVR